MFSTRLVTITGVLIAAFTISGCSGVIHKRINTDKGKGLSLGARQRVVLVTKYGGKDGKRRVVCAEPSPDVFAVRAASAAFATKGIFGGQPSTEGGQQSAANAGFSTSESAATISRTQTIQLLRDGLFRLCEAYMNGAVDQTQYNVALVNMDKLMTSLLAIDTIGGTAFAPAVGIVASSKSSSGGEGGTSTSATGTVFLPGSGPSAASIGQIIAASKAAKEDDAQLAARLASAGSGGGTTIINPPGRNQHDTSDESITTIALAHRRTGDKLAAFAAMCVGIMNRKLDTEPPLTPSQKQLRDQCNKYLTLARNPQFLLALTNNEHFQTFLGDK